MSSAPARAWPLLPLLRAVLAVVALASQLALGSLAPPDRTARDAVARLGDAMVLCGGVASPPAAPAHPHHPWAARPLALALELPAVMLLPGVFVSAPVLHAMLRRLLPPPARAPPVPPAWAFHARGPPPLA